MPTTRSASRSRSSPTAPSTPTPLSTTVTSPPPQRPVGRSSRLSQRLSTAHDTGSPSASMSPLRERSSRALNKQSSVSMAEELLVDKALPQELDDKVSLTTESIENRARNEETIESSSKANHASTSTLPVTPSRRSTRSMSRTPMNLPVDTTASSSRRRASRMRSESVAPEVASGEAVAAHTRSHDMKGSAAGEATDNAQLRPASADRDRGRQGFRNAFTKRSHSNDVSPTVLTPTITTTSLPPNLHVQTMNQDTTPSANKEIAIDSDSQDEEVTPRALQPPLPNLSQDMQSDVDSGISSDIESEEDEDSDAEVLLSRAIQAASRSKAVLQGKDAQPVHENPLEGGDEQDLWLLEAESSESKQKRMQEKAIPGVSIPSASRMPLHHLSLGPSDKKGKKRLELVAERATRRESGSVVGSGSHPIETTKDRETDDRQYEKEQSRQDKLKLAPRQTKSQAWSSLPPIPSALLPQMKRDYQALALRDSLDPKRFMKGKTKAVPEHFAIGTLVAPPRHLQSTTIQRERAYRPGDIVQSIVDDSELGVFAKRKFDDFAGKKMEHGRGKGWKKRKGASWK